MEPKNPCIEILYTTWYNLTNAELFVEFRDCSFGEVWLLIFPRTKKPGYARKVNLSQFHRLTTPKRWIKWVLALIRVFEKGSK